MAFTVLSDNAVKELLNNIQHEELKSIQAALNNAFTTYSLENGQQYQPHRASVTRPNGETTLFMPTTTADYVGTKIIGVPPADSKGRTLTGVVVLCNSQGKPIGIMNAEEITAFRTALGSMSLLPMRKNVANVVVFGAGKQALWHTRLVSLLRPGEMKQVTIVNRSQERTKELVQQLGAHLPETVKIKSFDPPEEKREDELRGLVSSADVIFCTTPATTPLFPQDFLSEAVKSGKGPYIAAIGSYKESMTELDPSLFRKIVDSKASFNPRGENGGVIVVDSISGCMQEAGEIMQGKLDEKNVIEIGELLHLLSKESGNSKADEWLKTGFVVYKSVGMGVMDLAVGGAMLDLAKSKDIGNTLGPL